MQLLGRHWSIPRVVTLSVCIVAVGFVPTLAYGSYVTRDYGRPGVTILGAGNDLSLLVTDGPSRLLIAYGDDASAFGNALAAARPFGHSRIDILLLIGSAQNATFLARARNAADARHIDVIGPPALTGLLGLPVGALVNGPRRYQMSSQTTITVDVAASPNNEADAMPSWRITIEHGQTRWLIVPDGDATTDFPDHEVATALIASGNDPISALDEIQPLVVIRSGNVSTETLREDARSDSDVGIWTFRVFGGEATSFALTERGLSLPSGGVLIEPDSSPVPT